MASGAFWAGVAAAVWTAMAAGSIESRAATENPRIERLVRLKERVEARSQTVCLQDLVEDGWLQSRCAIDRQACCRWTLEGDRSRGFRRAELQAVVSKLRLSGFAIELTGPEEVIVTQTHRELLPPEVSAKIAEAASLKLGEDGAHVSVVSLRMSLPTHVALAEESEWDIVLPEPIGEPLQVKIVSTRDPSVALGWAQASVRAENAVFVARRMIRPTDVIRAEDFELRRVDILAAQRAGGGTAAVFRKNQFPEGVRARLTVHPGAPLTLAAVERLPIVRLGDMVTLVLRSDNLKVSTKAIVQGAAAVGDMVTVQLSRFNRTFRGKLIEGRCVEVWL